MFKLGLMSVVVAISVLGCGGGDGGGSSGVSGSKQIVELSASEAQDLCEYLADLDGPARTIDCGGGVTVDVGGENSNVSECVATVAAFPTAAPNCTATVSDAENCFEAVAEITDAEWCGDELPAAFNACTEVFSAECDPG